MPKTAGQSVKAFLRSATSDLKIRHMHPSAVERREDLSNFESIIKLSAVRNPWDKTVSTYFYRKKEPFRRKETNCSLKEWFLKDLGWINYNQVDRLSDNNVILVDKIFTFENIDLLNKYLNDLGLPGTIPYTNRSNHDHYTTYYDDELRELVAQRFAKDIELFGYKFDDPYPTKPVWEKNAA